MKATELRIGNLVLFNSEIREVTHLHEEEICVVIEPHRRNVDCEHPTNFQGIPLTEDLLIKLGFEKSSNRNNTNLHLVKHGIYFPIDKGKNIDETLQGEIYYHIKTLVKIPTVHQLQNLYFAMTGDELGFKSGEAKKENEKAD